MNKNILTFGITILFINLAVTPITGSTEIKDTNLPILNGKTLYVGGTGQGNYTKIQEAINDASDGDTIYVYNGTYHESIIIDKSLNIFGRSNEKTIILPNNKQRVVYISANDVLFEGFRIKEGEIGILVVSSNNIVLKNNYVTENIRFGINISKTTDITIIENIITFNLHQYNFPKAIIIEDCDIIRIKNNSIIMNAGAIHINKASDIIIENNFMYLDGGNYGSAPVLLDGCKNTFIRNNTVKKFRIISLQFSFCKNMVIENNTFTEGFSSVYSRDITVNNNNISDFFRIWGSSNLRVKGNNIKANKAAEILFSLYITFVDNNVSNMRHGIYMNRVLFSRVENNLIEHNTNHGIWINLFSNFNTIEGNIISNNSKAGICCWGSHNIIKGNLIRWNGEVGLIFRFTSWNNKIYRNNFIENNMNARTFFNFQWYYRKEGNYWSDYKGQDINGDGVGDIPYRVPRGLLHLDRYPAIEPYEIGG